MDKPAIVKTPTLTKKISKYNPYIKAFSELKPGESIVLKTARSKMTCVMSAIRIYLKRNKSKDRAKADWDVTTQSFYISKR